MEGARAGQGGFVSHLGVVLEELVALVWPRALLYSGREVAVAAQSLSSTAGWAVDRFWVGLFKVTVDRSGSINNPTLGGRNKLNPVATTSRLVWIEK